jgi:hypothetical protein
MVSYSVSRLPDFLLPLSVSQMKGDVLWKGNSLSAFYPPLAKTGRAAVT